MVAHRWNLPHGALAGNSGALDDGAAELREVGMDMTPETLRKWLLLLAAMVLLGAVVLFGGVR